MTGIKLGSNLFSLRASGALDKSTQAMGKTYERLSSGLRINRASDDAAGLAISASLNLDSRVFAQGIRNLNDGVSLLNIAEGALSELSSITTRQKELAEQAANGIYSAQQRQALNNEASELTEEFNRIIASTKFNSSAILAQSSTAEIRFQAGYGVTGSIAASLGFSSGLLDPTGTFASVVDYGTSGDVRSIQTGDLNGDGNLDLVFEYTFRGEIGVKLGNGDGSFGTVTNYTSKIGGGNQQQVQLADIDEDGNLDALVSNDAVGVFFLRGNGDGTFQAVATAVASGPGNRFEVADINGDGNLDIIETLSNAVGIALGNGDGTFGGVESFASPGEPIGIKVADLNGDGNLDVAHNANTSGDLNILLGDGAGNLGAATVYVGQGGGRGVDVGDFNGDGDIDVVTTGGRVSLGNGDGTFNASNDYGAGFGNYINVADFNGDGFLDFSQEDPGANNIRIYMGNGDGTFDAGVSYAAPPTSWDHTIGDFNNDGVLDIAAGSWQSNFVHVLMGQGVETPYVDEIDLLSQASAETALTTLTSIENQINNNIGEIQVAKSRFSSALNTLAESKQNTIAATSTIVDADVATESAQLLRQQILQQAGTAVLAQANIEPLRVLRLIGSDD